MSQCGEGCDRGGPGPSSPSRRIPVRVRISLFFDGTGNNRVNIGHGQRGSRRYWWLRNVAPGPTDSFRGDVTNVARLAENLEVDAPGYQAYLRVYTEGIGTTNEWTDNRVGYGMGTGPTGILAKVNRGIVAAVDELVSKFVPARHVLELVSVDTCGFSRGAAAARYCVHRVLHGWGTSLRARLAHKGYEVGRVEVLAVGLFDTVSSHGTSYEDDVTDLRLRAIRQARAVYQLAAAEEYRTRFALTNIVSAGSKGTQVYLPGAHSDVGGGYASGTEEERTLVVGDPAPIVGRFLLDRGWFTRPELHYVPRREGAATRHGRTPPTPARLGALPQAKRRAYTFVPLRLMGEWLDREGLPIRARLAANHPTRDVPGADQIMARARTGQPATPAHWERVHPVLNALRHGFLHVSFRHTISEAYAHVVNYDGRHQRPTRTVYSG